MANSKANIYPIQLQNAELNLNKYDAEIKQYSGFNKNNAPFVGGCLSNIFTKDETIEGANGENVYIDDNGDIYQVTTEGLFKNDKKIISYDENTIFWENKKLNFTLPEGFEDADIVKVFNERFILVSKPSNVAAWGNEFHFIDIGNGFNQAIAYDINLDFCTGIFIPFENKTGFYLAYRTNSNLSSNKNYINLFCYDATGNDGQGSWVIKTRHTNTSNAEFQVALQYNETHEQLLIFYNYLATVTQIPEKYNHRLACSYLSVNEENILGTGDISAQRDYVIQGLSWIPGQTGTVYNTYGMLWNWHVLNYPINSIVLKDRVFQRNTEAAVQTLLINEMSNLYIENSRILYESCKVANGDTTSTSNDDKFYQIATYAFQDTYIKEGLFSPLVCSFDYRTTFISVTASSPTADNYSYLWHCANDYIKNFGFKVTETNGTKFVLGDFIPLGNFNFACNNNQLSGVCGKNVLLSNWNELTAESFIYCGSTHEGFGETLCYKNGNNWYVFKHSTPKIKRVINQLVINADSMKNSFELKQNKILHYASAFNTFTIHSQTYDGAQAFYMRGYDASGHIPAEYLKYTYIGVSVNEYNQKDNSSILINPVQVSLAIGNGTDIYYHYRNRDVFKPIVPYTDDIINIYLQQNDYEHNEGSENEILYNYSSKKDGSTFYDMDLYKLPYPTDTNGNVEYSPSLFSEVKSVFGNQAFIKNGETFYPLAIGNDNLPIMSFFMASGVDNFEEGFIIQGQFYGIMNSGIYSIAYYNGVVGNINFIVSVENLQFCGNTPYEALFYSKTNRCLYSFTGANILQTKQFVDKISVVKSYKYNPATQSIFLLTDIGVIVSSLFGIYQIDMPEAENMFLLDNGVVLCDNEGHYRYIRYYIEDTDEDYIKNNIKLETCFYGMNNQTVTVNDCLYMRLFSEEHEEGDLEISATTISNLGKVTEKTTFKIKKSDWDKETHTIYLRYQPKEQRGLGISFKMNSPFKIASLAVGSQPDAILIDKVSKGAINAPNVTSSNIKW